MINYNKLYLDFISSFDTLLKDANEGTFGTGFKGDLLNIAERDIIRENDKPLTSFQNTLSQTILATGRYH